MNRITLFFSQRMLAVVFAVLAVTGSIFLYSYVKDLRERVPESTEFREIILAKYPIEAGQNITEDLLTRQPISQDIFSDKFIYDQSLILGKKAKEDMIAGELISIDKIDDLILEANQDIRFSSYIPSNMKSVSIPVNYYGDRQYLINGDRIDLISVFHDSETNRLVSETIMQQKEIITISSGDSMEAYSSANFIDNAIGDFAGNPYQGDFLIITLYLESFEIEKVFLALEKGVVHLSICSTSDKERLLRE
jgi:Flp pilus assembly protein CpaB